MTMPWIKSRWLLSIVLMIAWASRASAAEKPLLIVANKHGNTLCYVDPQTYEILETIPTGPNPHEIVITPDGRFAYLSNYAPPGNTISLIDLPARKHVKQISTGRATRIHGAAMSPDGKFAYFTAGQTGLVVEVDTNTQSVTRTIPTEGKMSHMVLVSPDGTRLYTANIESEDVSVIDRATGRVITKIPCGKGVEGIAFTPDGKRLWAANQTGGSMTIIDAATGRPIETFPCGEMPVRIRFARGGRLALVPCWSEKGVVIVIDTATRKEIKRIPVGRFAIGIELSPDGTKAFVGCEHDDGIHVIDLDKMAVEAVIKTGDGPDPMMLWYPPEK
jgi:YVTN family beta-propeller protein